MADEESEAPSGGNKKLIIIGVVAAVVLIGGAVGITLALSGGDAPSTEAGAEAATEETKPAESVYIDLKPEFVINFRDRNNRTKFLKAEMAVSTRDTEIEEAVARHMPAIRNNLVLLLSRQIYEDLVPNEGKETLRQQALAEVQTVLESQIGKPGVEDLYFSNFVMH